MAQPAEVFVSDSETLPRELVASVARQSCKRCGGQGWYWFWRGAKRAPFVCPCAQGQVRANIAKAQEQLQLAHQEAAEEEAHRQAAAAESIAKQRAALVAEQWDET